MQFHYILTLERVSVDDFGREVVRVVVTSALSQEVLLQCRLGGRSLVQEEMGVLCDKFTEHFDDGIFVPVLKDKLKKEKKS